MRIALCQSSPTKRMDSRFTWWSRKLVAAVAALHVIAAVARAWSTFRSTSMVRRMKSSEASTMIPTHRRFAKFGLVWWRSVAPQLTPLPWSSPKAPALNAKPACLVSPSWSTLSTLKVTRAKAKPESIADQFINQYRSHQTSRFNETPRELPFLLCQALQSPNVRLGKPLFH